MTPKIATCCYCGTRAALVLDRARHDLSCSRCGAPLRDMKAMAKREPADVRPMPGVDRITRRDPSAVQKPPKPRKRRKRIWKDLWDKVEDLLD